MNLVRSHCVTCRSETLHKREVCIHCGTSRAVVVIEPKRKKSMPVGIRRPYSVEFRGEVLSLKEIAKRVDVSYATITHRFRHGVRGEGLVAKVSPAMARPKRRVAA
jgi:hypothetical protein